MEQEEEKEFNLTEYPNLIPFDCTKEILNQMEKNICKIKIGQIQGTGFFCKIPFPNEKNLLKILITNNHIINEDILYKKDQIISIYIKEKKKIKELNLNDRFKYTRKKEEYDVTIIEIKEEDDIQNYLELDDKIINDIINNDNENVEFIGKTHYIIQYPDGELGVSYGIISNIYKDKEYKFNHKCNTKIGSSGSPILTLKNKVIGIHTGGSRINANNMGTFLNYPIKDFINQNYCYYKNCNKNIIDYKINEIFVKEINNKFNLNIKNINETNYTSLKKYIGNDVMNEMQELFLYYKNKISSQILNLNFHKKIIEQKEKNVCHITTDQHSSGTGFFCKIPFPDEYNLLKVLITTGFIINESSLYIKDETINLFMCDTKEHKKLNLNNRMKYTNKKYGITIIEIKEEDGIKKYLELDDKIINDVINNKNNIEEYEDNAIYTILYNIQFSEYQILYGKLTNIFKDRKYEFIHSCQTGKYTTGSPIFNLNNKVIGVHFINFGQQRFMGFNELYSSGFFLNYPIKEFIQKNFYNNDNIKEISAKTNIKKNNKSSQERLYEKFSFIEKNFGSKIFKDLNKLFFNTLIEFEFYLMAEKEQNNIFGLNSDKFYHIMTYKNYITENCIYTIKLGNNQSIGFFCKIPLPNKNHLFHILITIQEQKNEDLLNDNDTKILISNDKYTKELILLNRRIYKRKSYDITITIIEIKEEDGINNYLELDDRIINYIINNKKIENKNEPCYMINYNHEILNISYLIDYKYKFFFLPKEDFTIEYELFNFHKRIEINGNLYFTVDNKLMGITGSYGKYYYLKDNLTYSIEEFIHKFYDAKNE